jgi:hypothetical protein
MGNTISNPKFKKGDICISKYQSRSNKTGLIKRNCKVRITSISRYDNVKCYNVYNIDFKRYETIGEFYLELDLSETRDRKLEELLNDIK